jgi:hypothetical protein
MAISSWDAIVIAVRLGGITASGSFRVDRSTGQLRFTGQYTALVTQRALSSWRERFPRAEGMFIEFHVHTPTAKLDSFHAETKVLLRGSLSA